MAESIPLRPACTCRQQVPSIAGSAFAVFAGRVTHTLATWRRRSRGRAELDRLDERLLKDIAITRECAKKEAAKPFWM